MDNLTVMDKKPAFEFVQNGSVYTVTKAIDGFNVIVESRMRQTRLYDGVSIGHIARNYSIYHATHVVHKLTPISWREKVLGIDYDGDNLRVYQRAIDEHIKRGLERRLTDFKINLPDLDHG